MSGTENAPRQVFSIDLGRCDLTVEQVWPDGGAPENPTSEDVAEVMRNYGSKLRTVSDWNLLSDIYVDGVRVW